MLHWSFYYPEVARENKQQLKHTVGPEIILCLTTALPLALSLVFRNLAMMCLGMDSFEFIIFVLHSTFWIYTFTSFAKLGRFKPLFLWVLFLFKDSDAWMLYNPIGLWDYSNFLKSIFLFPFPPFPRFGDLIYIALSSSSLILFFHPLFCYWVHPLKNFFQSSYYSVLNFSIWFFIDFISLLRFTFYLFQMCLYLLIKAYLWWLL